MYFDFGNTFARYQHFNWKLEIDLRNFTRQVGSGTEWSEGQSEAPLQVRRFAWFDTICTTSNFTKSNTHPQDFFEHFKLYIVQFLNSTKSRKASQI